MDKIMKKFIFAIFVLGSILCTYPISGTDALSAPTPSSSHKILQSVGTTKVVALVGFAIATSYTLYSYFTRFNVKDAHSLTNKIHEFIENTHRQYNREIILLINNSDLAKQQEELALIILDTDSPTPYLDYVTKTADYLNKCKSFLKKIEKGTLKLKASLSTLTNKKTDSL